MKRFFYLFFFVPFFVFSQNFEKVDEIVLKYPSFTNVEDLSNRIQKDFVTENDKVRAAFFWLAKNIRYNLKEYYNPTQRSYNFSYSSEEEKQQKLQAIKDKIVSDAFKNKLGVCEEYAQSFKKICALLHIKAEVIKGYVRNITEEIGNPSISTNHAWNAVKLNNKWIILDATWAAGYEYNGKWVRKFDNYFYSIPKDKIFKTHLPEDSLWVLRFGRITKKEFYNQPIYGNGFLNSKAELVTPTKGTINLKNEENITIKIKNLDIKNLIYYTVTGNKYAQKPLIKKEDNTTILTIKNPKINGDLVIYINKEDALQFKLKNN